MTKRTISALLPDRHRQGDLFICDIHDAAPKGDMSSMEHPVFSLATRPDRRPRHYQRGENWLKVNPSQYGLATVHDRDILIYIISQCMAALNAGRKVDRRLRFKAYDMLVATNRQTSGQGYRLLQDALRRLQGTQIETNIRQGGKEYFKVFGIIESAEIVRETRDGRMEDVEVVLSDWVFDAIENNHVLTLSRQYFRLRKPLERRLYEIARKHCGRQGQWKIRLDALREKCGSTSSPKEFTRLLRTIIADDQAENHMPDYSYVIEGSTVVIRPKRDRSRRSSTGTRDTFHLDAGTYEAARAEAPGWDVYYLEAQWREWILAKGVVPKHPDRHFLAFCKRRGPERGLFE